MTIDFRQLFTDSPVLMIFTVIAMGLLVGRLKIGSIELGSTTGVLLTGLLFGHLGLVSHPLMGTFGFSIFIFAVGLQAGPTFFSVFLTDGKKYIVLAVVVAVCSLSLALVIGKIIGLDYGMNAGLLAGALTSTPTLAGAQDAISGGLANLPEGVTAEMATQNVGVAYAITYIFGTMGLIVFIRYLPVLLKIDLPEQARILARERGFGEKKKLADSAQDIPLIRAYRVPESVVGQTLGDVRDRKGRKGLPLRIRRGEEVLEAADEETLQEKDHISIVGSLADHDANSEEFGAEILDPKLLNYNVVTKEVIVISSDIVGHSLADQNIAGNFGCLVRGLTRASVELPIDGHMTLNKGDRLSVSGEESHLDELAARIGRVEAEETATDLLTFSIGIGIGVMIGMIMINLGGVSIGLGSAGGLLLVGILFGFLRSMFPTFGGVPPAARSVLMEFGLVLFMAGVGLGAGKGIVEGFMSAGPQLIVAGIVITLSPVLVAYFIGRRFLKMNPAILLGSIAGSMTSTPSLTVVNEAAKSDIPALGYAGTYTFANVLLTFAGTIMMRL